MNPGTVVGQILVRDLQETNEYRFSRKHINGYIEKAIRDNGETEAKVHEGVALVTEWMDYWSAPHTNQCKSTKHHANKKARLQQLNTLLIEQLVRDIYCSIAYCQRPELFVSVTAQLAAMIGFDDHKDSVLTVAELVTVLCHTDLFDIIKASAEASLMIQSKIPLPSELIDAARRSRYLPPMVCKPADIESNYENPHLTFNDCLLLGKGNAHCGDICLDVINTQNQTALRLSTGFLSTVEEEPTHALDNPLKIDMWAQFKQESHDMYKLMVSQGNEFYLTNKYDKRGRLYSQGYHINPQGSAYKKAMLELHNEEIVDGVPG